MAEKILVTGATGTVGSLLVKALRKKGASVRAGVHTQEKAHSLEGPGVEPVELDYSKKDTVRAALKGVEKLYLLTPFSPDQAEAAELMVTEAKEAGVGYIVRQSGMGVSTQGNLTVARLHARAENLIEESGIPFTFLRPNFFMQNFINYFGVPMQAEGKLYLPLGDGTVSYVDAGDVASVAAEVLTNPGHDGMVYTLTGPEALSVEDVAGEFSKVAGRPITYVDVPEDDARGAMKKSGMDEWTVDALMELHGVAKAGLASAVVNTVEEIIKRPPHTFGEFARESEWFFKAGV